MRTKVLPLQFCGTYLHRKTTSCERKNLFTLGWVLLRGAGGFVCFLLDVFPSGIFFQLAISRLMETHRQSERGDWAIRRATRVPELSQSLMMAQRHRDLPDITAALTSTQRRHFPSDDGSERSSYPNYPLLPAPLPHSTWAPHFSSSLSFISLVSCLTPPSFSTRLLSVALSIPP